MLIRSSKGPMGEPSRTTERMTETYVNFLLHVKHQPPHGNGGRRDITRVHCRHMVHWEKLLRSLGFTESEAKIYLLSLEMGATPVQDLAKKAKVSRVTTYTVIESLMADGLMSTVQKGKKNLY